MKCPLPLLVVALFPAIALSTTVYAHDPSEHAAQGEKPNCSALQNKDKKQMNMSDPVMQAVMKKCAKAMHEDAMEHRHDAMHEQQSENHEDSESRKANAGHD